VLRKALGIGYSTFAVIISTNQRNGEKGCSESLVELKNEQLPTVPVVAPPTKACLLRGLGTNCMKTRLIGVWLEMRTLLLLSQEVHLYQMYFLGQRFRWLSYPALTLYCIHGTCFQRQLRP